MLTDFVNGNDVRMIEVGGGLGLGAEALHIGRRSELAGEDHLQGDGATQTDLPGAVHDTDASASDLAELLVIAEGREGGTPRRRRTPIVRQGWRIHWRCEVLRALRGHHSPRKELEITLSRLSG